MKIKYDADKLWQYINDFYKISGISITITGANRERIINPVAKTQEFCLLLQKNNACGCLNSDDKIISKCLKTGKPTMHICHAGLLDAALPIIVEDEVVGYITMGQVRISEDFSSVKDRLPKELHPQLELLWRKLPICSVSKMESAVRIANALITKIITENMIEITTEEFSILVSKYIEENLTDDLSIEKLCHHFNVSKNRLYECFHLCFNQTINGYITGKRIEKSVSLLMDEKLSIEEVAKESGFSDVSYFYKVFKKETGQTPKSYRLTYLKQAE